MLPVERRQFILDELYKNKAVAVNELAQQLGVTTMTIRRDLQLLEDNGVTFIELEDRDRWIEAVDAASYEYCESCGELGLKVYDTINSVAGRE